MPEKTLGATRDDVCEIDKRQKGDGFGMMVSLAKLANPAMAPLKQWTKPLKPLGTKQTVALLFLTRGDLNYPKIWRKWMNDAHERITIYAHAKSPENVKTSWLAESLIGDYVETSYGTASIIAAELALLRAAVANKQNQFFILVSESCLPVKPLSKLLAVLEKDGRSRLIMSGPSQQAEANASKASRMREIAGEQTLSHSQWWILNREAAELICREPMLEMFARAVAPDEMWPGTPLNLLGYPIAERFVPLNPTWVKWLPTAEDPLPPSPATWDWDTLPTGMRLEIETGGWFFARKFSPL